VGSSMNQAPVGRPSLSTGASHPTKMSRATVLRCCKRHSGKAPMGGSPWRMFTMYRHPRLSPRTLMEGGHEFGAPAQHLHILATYPHQAKVPTQPRAPPLPMLLETQEMLETRTPSHEDPRHPHLPLQHSNNSPPHPLLRGPSLHGQQAVKDVDFSGLRHSKRSRGAPHSGTVGQTQGQALLLLPESHLPKETHQQLVPDKLSSRSPPQSQSRANSRTTGQLQPGLRKLRSSRRCPSMCPSRQFHNNNSSNRVGVRS